MFNYILRRLLLMVPTLIGMTAIVFFVVAAAPGGIGAAMLSNEMGMRPAERELRRKYLNERYGLDRPLIVQYGRWLHKISPLGIKPRGTGFPKVLPLGFKTPDLGDSFARGRKVSGLVAEVLPITILLQLLAMPMTYAIATVAGIQAARHRGKLLDVASGTAFLGMWSFPVILAGVLMIGYFANVQYFYWFPPGGLSDVRADSMPFLPAHTEAGFQRGWLLDRAWHLVLPVICLAYGHFAFLSKLARGSVLENLRSDYVRTARAKGLGEKDVLYRHVLSNSLIPLITVAAQILPAMLAGSVIVENIFSIQGMGKLLVDAVETRDSELFLSLTMALGFIGLLSYLVADILYAVVDPRVTYE
jgi:peptide/nickel transport system permease protein